MTLLRCCSAGRRPAFRVAHGRTGTFTHLASRTALHRACSLSTPAILSIFQARTIHTGTAQIARHGQTCRDAAAAAEWGARSGRSRPLDACKCTGAAVPSASPCVCSQARRDPGPAAPDLVFTHPSLLPAPPQFDDRSCAPTPSRLSLDPWPSGVLGVPRRDGSSTAWAVGRVGRISRSPLTDARHALNSHALSRARTAVPITDIRHMPTKGHEAWPAWSPWPGRRVIASSDGAQRTQRRNFRYDVCSSVVCCWSISASDILQLTHSVTSQPSFLPCIALACSTIRLLLARTQRTPVRPHGLAPPRSAAHSRLKAYGSQADT